LIAANTNVPILVFDMTTLQLIDTITYTAGGIEYYFGKEYFAKRRKLDLAFVYESTMNTVKFITKKGACYDCGGKIREAHICPFVNAIGINLTTDGVSVLSSSTSKYTTGMSLNYSVNCDRQGWLCSVGNQMSLALAYATAVEIYNYALTVSPNQRVNTSVYVNKGVKNYDGIITARDIAAEQYNAELTALLQGIRLPDDNHCFDCRKNIKYVTALP